MSQLSQIDSCPTGMQPQSSVGQASPWILMVGLPILLVSLLGLGLLGAPVAQAAPTVLVCFDTPYTTIQEGVKNVDPGGEVVICTGVYSESVNLSLMASAIGGSVGNVTLRAQSGDVTVNPLSGPALFISETFTGSITIDGLKVTSGDSTGMKLGSQFGVPASQVSGTVSILNSAADAAGEFGVEIYATGAISILNSQAISNDHGGFNLTSPQIVHLAMVTATGNGQVGFPGPGQSGILFGPPSDGFFSCLDSATPIDIHNTTANGNGGYGIAVGASFLRVGYPVGVADVQTHGNKMDGLSVQSYCTVDVHNADAGENAMNGFTLGGSDGVIVSGSSTATGNSGDGFCLSSSDFQTSAGDVVIFDTTAISNTRNGIAVGNACSVGVGLVGVAADTATQDFLNPVAAVAAFTNTTANLNGADGIQVESAYTATVLNVTANNNGDDGLQLGALQVVDQTAPIQAADALALADSFFDRITISGSLMVSNTGTGVEFVQSLAPNIGAAGITTPTTYLAGGNIVCQNTFAGMSLVFDNPFGGQAPPAPTIDATGNWWGSASGPQPAGTGNQVIDAANPADVGGVGDIAFDPWIDTIRGQSVPPVTVVGQPTAVQFQFSDDNTSPTVYLGQGVGNLNDLPPFTVSTDNGVVVGVSGGPASSILEIISADMGKLTVTLTPSSPGTANVSMVGPCGLQQTVPVQVVEPQIVVTKTVGTLPLVCADTTAVQVEQGTPVYYCLAVENTGDVSLVQHQVVDSLLGLSVTLPYNLAPGGLVTITNALYPPLGPITLPASITNTVVVTSSAPLGGPPAGLTVSASDVGAAAVDVTQTPTSLEPGKEPSGLTPQLYLPVVIR